MKNSAGCTCRPSEAWLSVPPNFALASLQDPARAKPKRSVSTPPPIQVGAQPLAYPLLPSSSPERYLYLCGIATDVRPNCISAERLWLLVLHGEGLKQAGAIMHKIALSMFQFFTRRQVPSFTDNNNAMTNIIIINSIHAKVTFIT